MRQGTIAAIAVAALLALAGCTGGDGPPSGERNMPTAVGSESAEPPEAGPTDPDPTSDPMTDPTETAPAPDPTDPDEQALLDLVRAEGTVSVIVEAALDGQAERGSDAHGRLIAEALDALEAELDPAHTTVTTRFERYPRLTLTVDEDGLRALFASSRVTQVWENRSIPLE